MIDILSSLGHLLALFCTEIEQTLLLEHPLARLEDRRFSVLRTRFQEQQADFYRDGDSLPAV